MITLTLLEPQTDRPLQQWQFQDRSPIRVGRASDNDIILDSYPEVSRYHFELSREGDRWRGINRGTNGTFVNGRSLSQGFLDPGAIVQLAKDGPRLQVQLFANSPPANSCTHGNNPPKTLFCIHCGEPLVEQQTFVREYQVLQTLGQGGMGTTYLAWDKQGKISGSPQLLVLKEMNADMAQIAKARELFEREARILQTLDRPGIPKYYDFFVEENKKYLAMELIHGQNLEQRIYEKGTVTPQQAIDWGIQTCEILDYLHNLDPPLVHRDIKPANLMVRHLDNQVVLLDFGAVKEIGTPLGTRIGAEGYSAPEQERGQPCPQSDLYAIAPTLVFLLTGHSPLKYYQHKGNVYRLEVGGIPTITPSLSKAIAKASEPQLKQRYKTAKELAKALSQCRG
ncbi:protein kinase domain-containing protein [Spirulina sp. 06S082]|uniref:protein kinase domain-containing protein n=1 Tax=Spirulina sp. 06S082 TaxID=3110248 RepID=UPI002B20CAE5|nr:protein kinase [Spirulina sp. 06S082]MEA5468547.1 protein kinase [Spirulina sp. 06S082]